MKTCRVLRHALLELGFESWLRWVKAEELSDDVDAW